MGEIITPGWAPLVEDRRCLFVVGVDPGVTTGWCALRVDWESLLERGFSDLALSAQHDTDLLAWRAGMFSGGEYRIIDQVLALCRGVWREGMWDAGPEEADLMMLSSETFRLRLLGSDEALLSPVRLNAILGYLGRSLPLPFPQAGHSPSDAKRVVTDERLRYWGLWTPGPADHPRDATRQAVLTARKMVEERWRSSALRQMPWLWEEE